MYHSFLIHSSADGHLGCFHVLAMINSAAMNTGVHVSLSDLVSLVCMPRSGIARSYGSSISKGISTLFSIVAVLVCIPTNSVKGFPFLHSLSTFISCRLLDSSYSDWCVMLPRWGFDLHFYDEWCWASFHVFVSHLLWRNICLVLWPIFWLGHLLFWNWATGVACIFLRFILCLFLQLLLFSPILRAAFSPCL